mgnify:CR=1 FL=1
MQSLLNVPAEVVSANINAAVTKAAAKKRRILSWGSWQARLLQWEPSQAAWRSTIFQMWGLQGLLQDAFSR